MKKALIAQKIHEVLKHSSTFLNRTDMIVFVAASYDEALKIHREQRVNLIIMQLDMPGMTGELFYSMIRDDAELRAVSTIIVCENSPAEVEQSARCRVNAVMPQPVHPDLLAAKAQQLLDIAGRGTLRVLLSARVEGQAGDEPFICRSKNVSATGMQIETDTLFSEGDQLSCMFYLPNTKKIEVSGKIVRTLECDPGNEDRQYGLMFTEITPEAKRQLIDFVEYLSIKYKPAGS